MELWIRRLAVSWMLHTVVFLFGFIVASQVYPNPPVWFLAWMAAWVLHAFGALFLCVLDIVGW